MNHEFAAIELFRLHIFFLSMECASCIPVGWYDGENKIHAPFRKSARSI